MLVLRITLGSNIASNRGSKQRTDSFQLLYPLQLRRGAQKFNSSASQSHQNQQRQQNSVTSAHMDQQPGAHRTHTCERSQQKDAFSYRAGNRDAAGNYKSLLRVRMFCGEEGGCCCSEGIIQLSVTINRRGGGGEGGGATTAN